MSSWEEAPEQDMVEVLYLLAVLGMPWCYPGQARGGGPNV